MSSSGKSQNIINETNEHKKNKEISNSLIEKKNINISPKFETKKPLEQVNISDLLALHKKS